MCLPLRIASMKLRSVHFPMPVASGVRFAVKLTPQGPAHAVLVAAAVITQGIAGAGAGGITMSCGWPDSARVMSGAGPFGPITQGVWQSWHPEVLTMYLPRSADGFLATAAAVAR